ncbi:DUF5590 domain-containing protein [Evansella tamaricis]|uniref:DUF5590 domain-containing protein n=1 Tax=Evansella tamaricis TaxID=2069301 RepID=A0ABS6JLT1_9BACI|nr:DUF5590 domain-containing protein [Evansella tamaricis]MBU9714632.1 DUF5590 domain-containing protein [Evansella tamaricis]
MKAWIIFILIVLLGLSIGSSVMLFNTASEPLIERQETAAQIALTETDLIDVVNVDYYHGRRSFQVVEGVDSNGEGMYVWIEELEKTDEAENEPQMITRYKSEGLTKSQVRSIINDELEIKELNSIRLGIIGSTPVYEITYVDLEDRHSFYYITFQDGSYIRHYQFRR